MEATENKEKVSKDEKFMEGSTTLKGKRVKTMSSVFQVRIKGDHSTRNV